MDGSVYDVFISFRGIDTRSGFTGNLHRALCGKQIKSFMDDHNLEKGAEINPALDKAIQTSRIALVILSMNYASSTFCLDELEKIMDCSQHKGMLVLPVFYEVQPSDVRYQRGEYANALNKHEARIIDEKEKIEKWRFGLKKISYFSGWNLKDYRYEFELIDIIVEDIIKKIHRLSDGEKEKHVTKPKNVENLVLKHGNETEEDLLLEGVKEAKNRIERYEASVKARKAGSSLSSLRLKHGNETELEGVKEAKKRIERYEASVKAREASSSRSSLRPGQVPEETSASQCFKAGLDHLEQSHLSDALSCFDESLSLLAKKQKEKTLVYFKSWK